MGKNANSYFLMEKETHGRIPADLLMFFNHKVHSQVKLYRNVHMYTFLLFTEYSIKDNADLLSSFGRTVFQVLSRVLYVLSKPTLVFNYFLIKLTQIYDLILISLIFE